MRKAEIKGVFSRSYCCYGNLWHHENNTTYSPVIGQCFDTIIVASSDKEWLIMTNQNLSLRMCWKLFWATLNELLRFIEKLWNPCQCKMCTLTKKKDLNFREGQQKSCNGKVWLLETLISGTTETIKFFKWLGWKSSQYRQTLRCFAIYLAFAASAWSWALENNSHAAIKVKGL